MTITWGETDESRRVTPADVHVLNAAPYPISSVVLHIAGDHYPLEVVIGTILPGQEHKETYEGMRFRAASSRLMLLIASTPAGAACQPWRTASTTTAAAATQCSTGPRFCYCHVMTFPDRSSRWGSAGRSRRTASPGLIPQAASRRSTVLAGQPPR